MNQIKYKKNIYSTILIGTMTFLFSGVNYAEKISYNPPQDVSASELRVLIVDGWETVAWEAQPFPTAPEGSAVTNIVKGRPENLNTNTKNLNSLGLKFSFVYPGNNKIELLPPKEKVVKKQMGQLDENNKPKYMDIRGIELPGKVYAISTWVLGRGADYDLECWIQDSKGTTYVLKMGSLNFVGWRPLTVKIPVYVPQDTSSLIQNKTLVFRKFVIRSTPLTEQGDVVMFFDSLKILTKVHQTNFDGSTMNFDEADKAEKDRLSNYVREFTANAD